MFNNSLIDLEVFKYMLVTYCKNERFTNLKLRSAN